MDVDPMATERGLWSRLNSVTDVVSGRLKDADPLSLSALVHHDALIDLLMVIFDECCPDNPTQDKHVTKFLAKYAGCVEKLRKLRVSASDFDVKGVIGRGHFGEVKVVREKSTNDVFAMKVMKKEEILKQSDAAFFQEERDIMAWSTSPWLTPLTYAFMDSKCLYLVMEFHPGGDLLTVMEKDVNGEILTEQGIIFYLVEITAALNDLHQLGFVHRDVKPDNVLITASGHIKLVDFGSAARLKDGVVTDTALPVGTPEYIAPEVLTSLNTTTQSGSGGCYGVCCDWWSLGIIGYELLAGFTPFEGDTTTQTYGHIMNFADHLQFPEDVGFSDVFKDLLYKLLSPQNTRIQFEEIKNHAFFTGVPWTSLFAMPPPYVPKVEGVDDTSNFEPPSPPKKDRLRSTTKPMKGFSGKELTFVGFTFSRNPHTPRESTRLSVTGRSRIRSLSSESLSETTLETSEVELSVMIAEVKQILQSREKALSKVEESHKVLQNEQIMKQSELEELQRALEIERSERQSAESKTLRLLAEVREYHEKIVRLKEAKAKDSITQYQKALVLAELEKKDAAVKVGTLQDALKQQMKETEHSDARVAQLLKKMSELKEAKRKELVGMQNKILQTFKDSEIKVKELEKKLETALEERGELLGRLAKLQGGDRYHGDNDCAMEVTELKDYLSSSEVDDLKALLSEKETKLQELDSLLSKEKREKDGRVEELESMLREERQDEYTKLGKLQSLLNQVREEKNAKLEELESLLIKERGEKDTMIRTHQEFLSTLKQRHKSLEVKLEHLEQLKETSSQPACEETSDNAYDNLLRRVMRLEDQNLSLKQEVSQHELRAKKDAELLTKGQENLVLLQSELMGLKESKEKERQVLLEELEGKASGLKAVTDNAATFEKENSDLKKRLAKQLEELETLRASLSNEDLGKECADLKKAKASCDATVIELTKDVQSLERRVSILKEARSTANGELRKVSDRAHQLQQELETHKLNSEVLADQLKSAESQIEDLKMSVDKSEEDQKKWLEQRKTLEGDLESAESRLEETATLLNKERSLRMEIEEQNVRSLEIFQRSSTLHSEEIKRYQQNLFVQKQLAESYSKRITELERSNLSLKSKSNEMESKMDRMTVELSTAQKEVSETRQELNRLKASYLKLSQESETRAAEIESMTVANRERQEQLRVLLIDKEEQEYRMKTTIEQQTKLITHAMQSRSPPKVSKLKKKLRKIIPRSRNPEQEVEEWKKLTGMIQRSSSLFSPSSSVSQKGSPSKRQHTLSPSSSSPSGSVYPEDSVSMTTSPQSLKRSPRIAKSIYIPSASSNPSLSQSSGVLSGRGMERVASADFTASTAKRPQLTSTLHHDIPHKFASISLMLGFGTSKCVVCKQSLSKRRKNFKCLYCKILCHPECAKNLPNNCGLPEEMVDAGGAPPSKRAKGEDLPYSSASPLPITQGLLSVYRPETKQKNVLMWAVLTNFHLKIFTTELAARREHPVITVPLCDPKYRVCLVSEVESAKLPGAVKGPVENVFVLKCGKKVLEDMYFTAVGDVQKRQWVSSLTKAIGSLGGARDISIELKPLDLTLHSSTTDLSISSDMFCDLS